MIRQKHFLLSGCIVVAVALNISAADSTVTLPAAQTDIGKPLMQVLKERRSLRTYSDKPLSKQDLANLLWAGFGINRPETGGRTAPSAMNRQEIDVYVALPEGVYRYDAKAAALRLAVSEDLRAMTGNQPFVKTAPCNILLVVDRAREGGKGGHSWAEADAAFISENLYLYCASQGLATVVRANLDKNALAEAMKLSPSQEVIFAQTVGYPK